MAVDVFYAAMKTRHDNDRVNQLPSVPTKLFVLKCAMQVLVSIEGGYIHV